MRPDLVSVKCVSVIGCHGHVTTRSGHINYNNYCSAFRSVQWLFLCYPNLGGIELDSLILKDFRLKTTDSSTHDMTMIILQYTIDRKISRRLQASL